MPKLMKPPTDGFDNTDTGGDWYDGPPPPPALYKGKVKYLALGKIKTGDNAGGQRLTVVVEITEGKFKGAGIGTGLNLTKQGEPYVNQFLRSLTDGSEAQWVGIREAFWRTGYLVGDMDAKKRLPIERIGKKTNPIGMSLNFVTKMNPGDDGVTRADIARFVTPFNDNESDGGEDDALDSEDDFSDALDDADSNDAGDTDEDTTEDVATDDETPADPETGKDVVEDADDPWSV